MLESTVQSKIIRRLIKSGWFVRKIIQTNCPGDPDLFLYKAGRVVWIEAKRPGKEAEPLQEYRHREIVSAGMECYAVDSYDSFLSIAL